MLPIPEVNDKVTLAFIVMVPESVALEQPPDVITVYGNTPATLGVPDIVKVPPA